MLLPLLINLRMFDLPIAADVDGFKPYEVTEPKENRLQKRLIEQDEEIIEIIKHFLQCL